MDTGELYRHEVDLLLGDLEGRLKDHEESIYRRAKAARLSPAILLRFAMGEVGIDELEALVRDAEASG